VVGDGKIAHEAFFSGGTVGNGAFGKTDFFHEAFGQDVIYIIALHIQKLILH
jgi:hypothetical protein